MSKKKVTGNTMTLKDFHGGSIPSDLSLPSAPGVTKRTSDRSGSDRPSSWGNPMGRSDSRARPHTSPATRHYDDKSPFLMNTVQIGKNFDEDERKPLGGVSAPRRTINDESIWAPPAQISLTSGVEVKPDYGLGGSSLGRPVSQTPVGTVNSYSASFTATTHVGVNSEGGRDHGTGGVNPNVWATRKEVASSVDTDQSLWSGPNAASKLAHASALEKVSSGIWQSKAIHHQTDVKVTGSSEVECGNHAHNGVDRVGEAYYDGQLARHAEKGIDNHILGDRNKLLDHERSEISKYSDMRPRSTTSNADRVQLARNDGKLNGSELIERPKLKLLPRTKALETSEPSVPDFVQVNDYNHVENVNEVHGLANFVKPFSSGTENGKEVGYRPKLNLKPRSQPLKQLEGNKERDRNALFGGARPRELVLKERGIDDVAIDSIDMGAHSNRIEHNIVRAKNLPDHSTQTQHGEKAEDAFNQRTGKKYDRKEPRAYAERVNAQMRNWHGDTGRNVRETDRKQVSERQPSPETWRKPVEQSKTTPDVLSMGPSRVASAVELAQAFSRSVSDPKVNDRFSGQRSLNTGRAQMPFSRLVSPTPRPQINRY